MKVGENYIAVMGPEGWPVLIKAVYGYPVDPPVGYPGAYFVDYRSSRHWIVSEAQTGLYCAAGPSRGKAIASFRASVAKRTPAQVQGAITQGLQSLREKGWIIESGEEQEVHHA